MAQEMGIQVIQCFLKLKCEWPRRQKYSCSCRGVGASLSENKIAMWETEHKRLLEEIAPQEFDILHYAAFAELRNK